MPTPSNRVTLGPDDPLPNDPVTIFVTGAAGWDGSRIATLHRHAERGGSVVVPQPPSTADWLGLLGVTAGPVVRSAEVVLRATVHPAARNLADEVHTGTVTTLQPTGDTETVIATRVHLGQQAAVTVRRVGDGHVVGSGLDPARSHAARTAVDRIVRGVAEEPAQDIGVGILGYGQHGGMGWYHANALGVAAGVRLAGIAEPHPDRLADAAKRFPDVAVYEGLDALLADAAVDLVIIATPPSTHYALTRQVLRVGRHAVVEKPLCFTAAEADDLLAQAAASGRMLTVHQNRRWDPDFLAIRRVIDEGALGEVFNVETFVGGFEHPCQLWHSDIGVSGGRLYDWGAHLIDQTLLLIGEGAPTEVSAVGHKRVWPDVTNLDQVRVRMRFGSGAEAEFLDSDILGVRRPKYLVQGTAGTLVGHYQPIVHEQVTADAGYQRTEHHHAEGPARLSMHLHHADWGLHEVSVPSLPAPAASFHAGLADHLQLGDPVPVDPAQIRTVTAVLEAAHASAHDGGRTIRPA